MQCKAHKKTGVQCGNDAIKGGTVCHKHGGSAPQVKKAAALRLAELVDPAIGVIARYLKNPTSGVKDETKLRAALAVLDRTGYHAGQEIHLKGELDVRDESPIDALRSRIAGIAARARTGTDIQRVNGKSSDGPTQ